MYDNYNLESTQNEYGLAKYTAKVFGWMFLGLLITSVMAFLTISSQTLAELVLNPVSLIILTVVELGMVFYLSARVFKMSTSSATALFLIYSALNGLTLSGIFAVYQLGTIFRAFGVAATVFGVMAIYGYVTKTDLTHVGSLFIMGVVGIIIATLINLFFRSSMLDTIISYVGIFLFLGLTAYDTQRIKSFYAMGNESGMGDVLAKGAILSALALYLDFINIFLFLLRLFGGSSKD